MRRKLISHSPEEVNLNNLDLLDKCLKNFLKNQSLRSRPWLIAFVYLFIYFFFLIKVGRKRTIYKE